MSHKKHRRHITVGMDAEEEEDAIIYACNCILDSTIVCKYDINYWRLLSIVAMVMLKCAGPIYLFTQ